MEANDLAKLERIQARKRETYYKRMQNPAVRGLLCGLCNKGFGQFKDNPISLARAIDYLTINGK